MQQWLPYHAHKVEEAVHRCNHLVHFVGIVSDERRQRHVDDKNGEATRIHLHGCGHAVSKVL